MRCGDVLGSAAKLANHEKMEHDAKARTTTPLSSDKRTTDKLMSKHERKEHDAEAKAKVTPTPSLSSDKRMTDKLVWLVCLACRHCYMVERRPGVPALREEIVGAASTVHPQPCPRCGRKVPHGKKGFAPQDARYARVRLTRLDPTLLQRWL